MELTNEEILVARHLAIQVWLKRLKVMPNTQSKDFVSQCDSIRNTLHENFQIFKEDVETPRGFRDNMKALFDGKLDAKKMPLPVWETLETMSAFFYDYKPQSENDKWEWEKKWREKTYWSRFNGDLPHSMRNDTNRSKELEDKLEANIKKAKTRNLIFICVGVALFFLSVFLLLKPVILENVNLEAQEAYKDICDTIAKDSFEIALPLFDSSWSRENKVSTPEQLNIIYRLTEKYSFFKFFPCKNDEEIGKNETSFYVWFEFINSENKTYLMRDSFKRAPLNTIDFASFLPKFKSQILKELKTEMDFAPPEQLSLKVDSIIDSYKLMKLLSAVDIEGEIAHDLNLQKKRKQQRNLIPPPLDLTDPYRVFFKVVMVKTNGIWKIKKMDRIM